MLSRLQTLLPARVKFALKPYYRTVFPNRLHALLAPTYRCNYRCSYCPVVTRFDFTTIYPKNAERTAEEWIEGLDKLPPAVLYIHGGEPFVYSALPDLINHMPRKHTVVGIVTNLSLPLKVYRRISGRVHLNVSFHREFAGQEEFVARVRELSGQFHIHVNIVATAENLPVLETLQRDLSARRIALHVDPLVDREFHYTPAQRELLGRFVQPDRVPEKQLDFEDFSVKSCSAGRNYISIAPDGAVCTCMGGTGYLHSTLYTGLTAGRTLPAFQMGNLFDRDFALRREDMICALPCKEACDRDAVRIRPAPVQAIAGRSQSPALL